LTAGFLGAMIGNPSDLALVRFQSDGALPPDQRRNYKHVFDAFGKIIKEEGTWALWRGSTPTVVRGMAMNLGMVTIWDIARLLSEIVGSL
jgi:solute carrier family 25 oxoglutarate transporter 11